MGRRAFVTALAGAALLSPMAAAEMPSMPAFISAPGSS
jgi:hypothetical protein